MTHLGCADTNLLKVFLVKSSTFSMRKSGTDFMNMLLSSFFCLRSELLALEDST